MDRGLPFLALSSLFPFFSRSLQPFPCFVRYLSLIIVHVQCTSHVDERLRGRQQWPANFCDGLSRAGVASGKGRTRLQQKPERVEAFPDWVPVWGLWLSHQLHRPLPPAHLQQIHNKTMVRPTAYGSWRSSRLFADLPVTSLSPPTTSPRPPTPPTTTSRPRSPSLASRRRTTRTTRASERTARSSLSGTNRPLIGLREVLCLGTSRPRGGRAGVRSPREADATGRTTARAPGGRGAFVSFLRGLWQ